MSPGVRWGRRPLMVVSTTAAGTISQIARGVSSFLTRSAIDEAPRALSLATSSTAFGDTSKTTHRWPPARSRRAMLAPMRPSPIIPSCTADSFEAPIARRVQLSPRIPQLPVATDHVVGRAVMAERGLPLALELRDDALGQHLAQLDSPLIERVDVPDGALGKHAVLVERDELSQRFRREPLGEDRVRGTIARERPMGNKAVRRALGLDLLPRLAEGQRLGLREHVRQQHVVVPAERIQSVAECDEVTGDETGSLVDQLVEGMLPVGSRLSPVDGPGRVADLDPVECDVLAVALHRQLLQVRGEALQVL